MRGARQDFKANGSVHSPLPAGHLTAAPERTAPVVFEQITYAVHAWPDGDGMRGSSTASSGGACRS